MDGTVWFDKARVERTVTRQFVCSRLSFEAISRLDGTPAFGDGLTDCTYWEWLKNKAGRLFLILVDLGLPERIFRLIDDSWEDEDLPIALRDVGQLRLTTKKNEKLERDFHDRQFFYLVRPLERGRHIDYQDSELVPLDVVEMRRGSSHDTARLPDIPALLCRRRVPLGLEAGYVSKDDFMWEINSIREIQHTHVACYWGSYTHRGEGYMLLTLPSDYKLSDYLRNAPPSAKNLDKASRMRQVLDRIHCMVDTVWFVHSRGASLGNIKPSTIHLTRDYHVVFTDAWRIKSDEPATGDQGGSSFDKESYNYAAPEQWAEQSPPRTKPRSRPPWATDDSNDQKIRATFSIRRSRNSHHSHHHHNNNNQNSNTAETSQLDPDTHPSNPQAADIFSLGCVILELLGHDLLKRSSSAFASFRAARHKSAGRGGAPPDSSFHANLGQVETWMAGLDEHAAAKQQRQRQRQRRRRPRIAADDDDDDGGVASVLGAVAPLLRVVERMLASRPNERAEAPQVRAWTYQIMTGVGELAEPHCARRYAPETPSVCAAGGGGEGDAAARGSQALSFLSLSNDDIGERTASTVSPASRSSVYGVAEGPLPPLSTRKSGHLGGLSSLGRGQ